MLFVKGELLFELGNLLEQTKLEEESMKEECTKYREEYRSSYPEKLLELRFKQKRLSTLEGLYQAVETLDDSFAIDAREQDENN